MKARPIVPVILSGGSGTRLWPLSQLDKPKQFHALVDAHTLFQQTINRTLGVRGVAQSPIVICNERHRFLAAEQLRSLGTRAATVVLEPAARNTAPAVAAAALVASQRAESEQEPLLLVLPADHVIKDVTAYRAAIEVAAAAATEGYLVTFGVVPTRAETGYGYIRTGKSRGDWLVLETFVEKPDADTARAYVESGDYLWNSGMFLLPASAYLSELATHQPEMLSRVEAAVRDARVERDFTWLGSAFADSPAESIDYAVMEKTRKAAVVPLDAGWSDVGSWASLHDVLEKDIDGNVLHGDVWAESCRDSLIMAKRSVIGAVGLDGIIVIETESALLVMSREHDQALKQLVAKLK